MNDRSPFFFSTSIFNMDIITISISVSKIIRSVGEEDNLALNHAEIAINEKGYHLFRKKHSSEIWNFH